MKKNGSIAITALALLPLLAMAQSPVPANVDFVPVGPGGGFSTVIGIVEKLSLWMLYGLLVLAGVFIVYAAYLYLTAAGSEDKVKSASNVIIYAVVAIGVGLLSQVIVAIAKGLVGAK